MAYLMNVVMKHDKDKCLYWPFARDGKGYGTIRYKGPHTGVHRIVCELIYGPKKGLWAIHSCGQGHLGCVAPRHLRWGTSKQNDQDVIRHGSRRGTRNGRALLTERDVRHIKANYTGKYGEQIRFVKQFGVSRGAINGIIRGMNWRHS